MSDSPFEEGKIEKRLKILEELEENPEIKQENLASRLGIGTGTVNWYINRLSKKGYLKMERIGQWQWQYILTPEGIKEKARLTKKYIRNSMKLYRQTRKRARNLLKEVKQNDNWRIYITGDNELAEICRLTAGELGLKALCPDNGTTDGDYPELKIDGLDLTLTSQDNE